MDRVKVVYKISKYFEHAERWAVELICLSESQKMLPSDKENSYVNIKLDLKNSMLCQP